MEAYSKKSRKSQKKLKDVKVPIGDSRDLTRIEQNQIRLFFQSDPLTWASMSRMFYTLVTLNGLFPVLRLKLSVVEVRSDQHGMISVVYPLVFVNVSKWKIWQQTFGEFRIVRAKASYFSHGRTDSGACRALAFLFDPHSSLPLKSWDDAWAVNKCNLASTGKNMPMAQQEYHDFKLLDTWRKMGSMPDDLYGYYKLFSADLDPNVSVGALFVWVDVQFRHENARNIDHDRSVFFDEKLSEPLNANAPLIDAEIATHMSALNNNDTSLRDCDLVGAQAYIE
jgi:hypothetical protein